jgi:hypothetical protein
MLGDAVRARVFRLRVSRVYWPSGSACDLLLATLAEAPGIKSFSL